MRASQLPHNVSVAKFIKHAYFSPFLFDPAFGSSYLRLMVWNNSTTIKYHAFSRHAVNESTFSISAYHSWISYIKSRIFFGSRFFKDLLRAKKHQKVFRSVYALRFLVPSWTTFFWVAKNGFKLLWLPFSFLYNKSAGRKYEGRSNFVEAVPKTTEENMSRDWA